jgi:hypothetical protein
VCLIAAAFGCSSSSDEKSGQNPLVNSRAEDKKAASSVWRGSTLRDIPMDTAKFQEKGVELLVEAPKLAAVGEVSIIKVSLTNKSKDDVSYDHINDYQDFSIRIQDEEDGKMVPRTRYGYIKLGNNEEERKKRVETRLNFGGAITHCYNLPHLFDLTIPSTYNLFVSIKLNDGVRGKTPFVVEVRNIKLRVLESGDLELAPFPLREDKDAVKP